MKTTTTIILAAALTLSIHGLFANNDKPSAPVANANSTVTMTSLAPSVPSKATFEDAEILNDIANLMPTVPAEASFDEMTYETVSALNLAPATSETADFNDADGVDFSSLAFTTPAEADFE